MADVEYIQTSFTFNTESTPADRLFLCRQTVDTSSLRLSYIRSVIGLLRVDKRNSTIDGRDDTRNNVN